MEVHLGFLKNLEVLNNLVEDNSAKNPIRMPTSKHVPQTHKMSTAFRRQ